MSNEGKDQEEQYLWTGEGKGEGKPEDGSASEETKELESLLAPMRQAKGLRATLPRPWLRALCIATLASLIFFALSASGRAPARFVALFHDGPVTELSMHGGAQVKLTVENGHADREMTLRVGEAMESRGADVAYAGDSQVVINLSELDAKSAAIWARRIASQGQFTMHTVMENTDFMREAAGLASEEGASIQADKDQWFHDARNQTYVDDYLSADSREELVSFFDKHINSGALTLPPGSMLAYERIENAMVEVRPWRSYLLDSHVELSQGDIESTEVYWHQMTNRPEVLIDFSREGGQRFGELTAGIVGRKLAFVIDGDVLSAPTVQAAIMGGSSSISMGGNDPQEMQAEAMGMAAVLRGSALPTDVSVSSVEGVEASVSKRAILAARALMSLLAGLCVFLLAWPLGRFTRSGQALIAPLRGGKRRLGPALVPAFISLVGVVAALALSRVWLSGAESIFEFVGPVSSPPGQGSIMALGILPFVTGAVLAELIAWVVPAWRKRRAGDEAERAPIRTLALLLGLGFMLMQAVFYTSWLSKIGHVDGMDFSFGVEQLDSRFVFLQLLAGSSILYCIAMIIRRYGLGNGYMLMLGVGLISLLPGFVENLSAMSVLDASGYFQSYLILAAMILLTVYLGRHDIRIGNGLSASLPGVGVAPLLVGPTIYGLLILVFNGLEQGLESVPMAGEANYNLAQLAVVVVLTLLMTALALRRPQASSESRVVSGIVASSRKARLLFALFVSLAFPIAVYWGVRILEADNIGVFMPAISIVLGTALMMDLVGEFRARWRNPELVQVWDLHRPRYLSPLTAALESAGIDVFVKGRNLRIMLSVLGPFVPMRIMVPEHRAEEAKELILSQL